MKQLFMLLCVCMFLFIPSSNAYASQFHPVFAEFNDNNGTRYKYLDENGEAKNRWIQNVKGNWYYAGADGYLLKNEWLQDTDSKWYYFGDNWAMLHDATTPDGYYVDSDGVWTGEEKGAVSSKPKSPGEAIEQKENAE